MRRSTQIIIAAAGFLAGIALATKCDLPWNIWLSAWLIIAVMSTWFLRRSHLMLIPILLIAFVLGIARQNGALAHRSLRTIDDCQYQKVSLQGRVAGEPYWDAKRSFVYYINELKINGIETAGQVRIKSLVGNAKEGYVVQIYGKLLPAVDKFPAQISYAKTTVLSTVRPPLVEIKAAFSDGVRRALPEPAASFMLGILIGARSTLPKELQSLLAIVGLSHLVAVSGYNLTIITSAIQRMVGKNWQWGGLIVSLWLMLGFVVLTGGSASIVRAGVMSALFLLARYYGRSLDTLACVALGAIITVAYNPSYLLNDLGWQLSFLALTGIVLLAPLFQSLIPRRFKLMREIIGVSLAAEFATLPLIALTFGQVSLVAPLANVVIMPFVPLLMLLGLALGLAGMLLPTLAYSLSQPVAWLISVVIDGLRYLGSLHWSALSNAYPNSPVVALLYTLMATLGLMVRRKVAPLLLSSGDKTKNAIIKTKDIIGKKSGEVA